MKVVMNRSQSDWLSYAQTDLLSYAHIKNEVDGLFRAYLDTKLMELANNSTKPGDYWPKVVTFRNSALDFPSKKEKDTLSKGFYPYRYWFDLRADYWSRSPGQEVNKLVGGLLPSAYLKTLYDQATALKERIDHIANLGTSRRASVATDKSDDGSPGPSLKTVLEKVEAPASAKPAEDKKEEEKAGAKVGDVPRSPP
jgi:hypothetical protein